MKVIKVGQKLQTSFTPNELARMLSTSFFKNLTQGIVQKKFDISKIDQYVKVLANKSVDTTEYEFYFAIFELYNQFQKDCEFCFNLKNTYDIRSDSITTLDELYKYKEDQTDVIVNQKGKIYDFELKRYRDALDFDSLFKFVKRKIIDHYSVKYNYFIILQPKIYSNITFEVFEKLHNEIVKESKDLGIIAFSLNHDNEEIITVQVFPEFSVSKRKTTSQGSEFTKLLNIEIEK